MIINLSYIYRRILDGKIKETLTADVIEKINKRAIELYNLNNLNPVEIQDLDLILRISNALYNNTSYEVLVLEDGIYDILLEKYKEINPSFQVGGALINNNIREEKILLNGKYKEIKKLPAFESFNANSIDKYLFKEIFLESTINRSQPAYPYHKDHETNRVRNTPHEFDELVGTLDKCKFVLDNQAIKAGVYEDKNVKIFERDFLGKHIRSGLINQYQNIEMIGELKYDGISVEATCSDRILSARTRGDLENNIAADLTDVLYGYKFPNNLSLNESIGIKFEAIITKDDLIRVANRTGKEYKNMRTAISGIINAANAREFLEYITLVPLATSIPSKFINREAEISFLNTYFATKQPLIYSKFSGTAVSVLFQINEFLNTAEKMRGFMNFAYDGIVASYMDKRLIEFLGRENHINKYSIAIKFNPTKRYTRFRGYEYSIGQNGIVTPIIYFDPVEFNGTIHKKASGHSFERFNDLGLHYNDILEVTYVNDVMPYVNKKVCKENEENDILYGKEKFIERCPYCNSYLQMSDSGRTMRCVNLKKCPGIIASRMSNMFNKLGFRNFSYESVVKLEISSLEELLNVNLEKLQDSGIVGLFAENFMEQINILKTKKIKDSKFIGALGFSNIAAGRWEKILKEIPLKDIIELNDHFLEDRLKKVKFIGRLTADVIVNERHRFMNDLIIIYKMKNVIKTGGINNSLKIRFSGVRDKNLVAKLEDNLCDASDGAVTKDTSFLIVPFENYESSKVSKAKEYNIPIISIDEFYKNLNKYIK